MAGGSFSGAFWGLLVGGVGVSVASVVGPQPAGNVPPQAPLVAAPVAETVVLDGGAPVTASDVVAVQTTATAPQVDAPAPQMVAPDMETAPPAVPQTLTRSDPPQTPEPIVDPDVAATQVDPVFPNPQGAAPQIPENEGDLIIATDPPEAVVVADPQDPVAQTPDIVVVDIMDPIAPDPPLADQADVTPEATEAASQEADDESPPARLTDVDKAEVSPAVEDAAIENAVNADVRAATAEVEIPAEDIPPTEVATAMVAPDVSPEVAVPAETATPAPQVNESAITTAEVAPPIAEQAATAQNTPVASIAAQAEEPADIAEPVADTAANTAAPTQREDVLVGEEVVDTPTEKEPATDAPAIQDTAEVPPGADRSSQDPVTDEPPVVVSVRDRPATLPQGAGGVKVNRRFGTADTPDDTVTENAAPQGAAPDDPDAPALVRFAADFENPEGKPLLAIVLLDDPAFGQGPRALAEVPFPVTIVLDPTAPDVVARIAAYRAQGIEVGVAAKLPEGAIASDAAVALEAAFAALPESVVLVDAGEGDIQSNSEVTDLALATLADGGRGFVGVSRGLNTGLRAAEAAGVPAATIFRDLDGDGQDARVIRRFIDQAAFRARQDGGVILMGRLRADTLSALILWGTANRAGQVALAPVSALLREQIATDSK